MEQATAREPETSSPALSKGHKRAVSAEIERPPVEGGHDASRLVKTNEALGKQLSAYKKTIDTLTARVAKLERDQRIQLGVIRQAGIEDILEMVMTMADEKEASSQGSGSTEDAQAEAVGEEKQQQEDEELDREEHGERDAAA